MEYTKSHGLKQLASCVMETFNADVFIPENPLERSARISAEVDETFLDVNLAREDALDEDGDMDEHFTISLAEAEQLYTILCDAIPVMRRNSLV